MTAVDDFKKALASWCSGVSVVTARDEEGLVYGLTVSSFSSLSLDPPLILVCVANRNRIGSMIRATRVLSVSLLAAEQSDLSNHFARPGREPAADLGRPSRMAANGVPVLERAIATVACRLHQAIAVGDHSILIGRVVEATADGGAEPLVYFRRGYRAVDIAPRTAVLDAVDLFGLASW